MAYLRSCPNISLTFNKLPFFRTCFNSLPSLRSFNPSSNLFHTEPLSSTISEDSPLAGAKDVMMEYISGNQNKSTKLAHAVWNHIVKKGDTVIDATCGNGHDTLAMLRMVSGSTHRGRVYAIDIQPSALEKTSKLLDQHVTPEEKELVELYAMCHSNLEDIIPHFIPVRLVAFNLGYLPRGNKKVTTRPETTLLALEAAERVLAPGGLISIMVYIGHSVGREEFETVQAFASGLEAENWSCCKLEMPKKQLAPILVLLAKRYGRK